MAGRSSASLLRSVAWFGASYGIAVLGYLGLLAAASRLVGRDEFGIFLVIVTATALIGQLGLIGVHRSGLREAARIQDTDVEQLADLRAGVRGVSRISLPAVSLVTGAATYLMVGGDTDTRVAISALTAALVYLNGQQKILSNYLRGLGRLRTANLLEGRSGGALVAVAQAAGMLVALVAAPDSGLVGALAAVTVGFALPVLAARIQLGRLWAHTPRRSGTWEHLVTVARRDWKFAVTQVGGYANSSMDLWLAAILLSPVSASLFGAGQRLAQLLLIPSTSLQVVFSPAIARLSVDPDRRRLQSLLRTGSSVSTAMTAVIWLPMVLAPGFVMALLFGTGFEDAAAVLMLLSTGYFMNAVSGLSGVTLSMSHHEGWVASVQWVGLVTRVVLGSLAAWLFGLIGLAVTSAVTTVFIYALMWGQARRRVGVQTHATIHPRLRLLTQVSG